jgi:hypothetical protein
MKTPKWSDPWMELGELEPNRVFNKLVANVAREMGSLFPVIRYEVQSFDVQEFIIDMREKFKDLQKEDPNDMRRFGGILFTFKTPKWWPENHARMIYMQRAVDLLIGFFHFHPQRWRKVLESATAINSILYQIRLAEEDMKCLARDMGQLLKYDLPDYDNNVTGKLRLQKEANAILAGIKVMDEGKDKIVAWILEEDPDIEKKTMEYIKLLRSVGGEKSVVLRAPITKPIIR